MKSSLYSKNSIFTSKANVLEFLKSNISKSKIEHLYYFTVDEWIKHNKEILNYITNNFENLIIVRSSALGEDSIENSHAGTYDSVLNINPKSKTEIKKAVASVIQSYKKKLNYNKNNQILIQNQSSDIILSGVIFTKTPDSGSPYYVINFEEGTSTEGVTKGIVNNTIKIARTITNNKIPNKWKKLILSIKELEVIFNLDLLDIEFGITKSNKIIIFQSRPMTFIEPTIISDKQISSLIIKNQKKFSKLNTIKHVAGKHTIFSDMCDWNPSEIIGNNPNLLDYSLYDFLIMKNAWHKGRTFLHYCDVNPYPLMTKFGNKPYVDVRGSFNSLIPNQLNLKLRNKLLNYYLHKLQCFPFLHDKVEFEILFTCYDVSTNSRLNELIDFNFSQTEITLIKKSLLDFTNQTIKNFPKISIFCIKSVEKLEKSRIQILNKLSDSKDYKQILASANAMLLDCKKLGTIPFSTMARIAFIGSIILKSLHNEGIVDSKSLNNFMNSISTPLSEIQSDIVKYELGTITKKSILKKYGHLRPGTYDINAIRYDMSDHFFNDITFSIKNKKPKFQKLSSHIDKILSKHGLIFQNIDFQSFVKTSLIQREKLKFEFTKSLSDAIELIAKAGHELGFSRQDMSNLSLHDIFKYNSLSKFQLIHFWKKKIQLQKIQKIKNNYLVLPPLLFSKNDFEIINYYISKPNFITNKKIIGNLVTLSSKQKNNLSKKIILIENADPGYDWIFTKNPLALITKYGGVASHMAIRCAEIGLPAAIGCGELIYEQLKKSSKILLDCKHQEILILEHNENNDDAEARKILKSLGYIK